MGTEQQVTVEKVIKGWSNSDREIRAGYSQFLGVVVFTLPANETKYSGFVLLDRHSGKLRLPVYFRQFGGTLETENLSMPDWVAPQVEIAARKFAGKLVANAC